MSKITPRCVLCLATDVRDCPYRDGPCADLVGRIQPQSATHDVAQHAEHEQLRREA